MGLPERFLRRRRLSPRLLFIQCHPSKRLGLAPAQGASHLCPRSEGNGAN
jgi:hypothetical protein